MGEGRCGKVGTDGSFCRLTGGTAGCTEDRAGAEVMGDCGSSTQANRPPFVATQSGLGYTERGTWPKGHPPAMT